MARGRGAPAGAAGPEGDPIDRQSDVRREPAPGLWAFLLLLLAYATVHAALRLWISPILAIDDAREAVFSQTLAWGYHPRQPPFYTWLVWGAVRLAGPSLAALTVLKYAVLSLGYLFAYLTARRVLADPRLAPLAAFSLLLLLPVGWFVHEDLTQSVAVLAAAAGTVYAVIRLEAAPALRWYAWVGVGLGLGTLSKLNYLVFAAALGLAALSVPAFRRRVLDPRIAVTLLVAILLVLPHAVWLASQAEDLPRLYAQLLQAGGPGTLASGLGSRLLAVLRTLAYYTAPLGLLLLAVVPAFYRRVPGTRASTPAGALVARTLLAGIGLLTLGAMVGALGQLKFRWAIPVLFLLPLHAWARLDRLPAAAVPRPRRRRYAGALVAVEALMIAAIVGQTYLGAHVGAPSRLNTPYDAVAPAVAAAGFADGAILAGPGPLGGNLRVAFPDARIVSLETPGFLPPGPAAGGACLVVWDHAPGDVVPEALAGGTPAAPIRTVTAPYRHTPGREYRAYFRVLPAGGGACP